MTTWLEAIKPRVANADNLTRKLTIISPSEKDRVALNAGARLGPYEIVVLIGRRYG
jgi:hypothetical protein